MNKETVLSNVSFGSRVAEDEADELGSYFVETDQWRQVFAGDIDVVYGSKGTGKSALYSLLVSQKDFLRKTQRIVVIGAENPRGTPAFRDLASDPPKSEEEFRGLWKLYFLALIANYLRHHSATTGITNPHAAKVIEHLSASGLLAPQASLIGRLKAIRDYVRRLSTVEMSVTEPHTGTVIKGKITLAEPNADQRASGVISADELIEMINLALQRLKITTWLVLDRLDVAFSDSPMLEKNALRALFRVYLDMLPFSNISIKIFLRDDIWQKLIVSGFREASHVTRTLTISWGKQSLLNLVVRRLIHNPDICKFYGVIKDDVLKDAALQSEFFYRVFPMQVDIGKKLPNTLDWFLSRTADASKRNAPRELIHLLSVLRQEQLRRYELGNSEPPLENLFDKLAIRSSMPEVSKVRYEQTLCAEHPDLKNYLNKLEDEKTQQTTDSLAKLWQCTKSEAHQTAEALVEVGFFERKGTKESPAYWVPFLYRDALRLV